jgi:hypothetical protein
MNNHHAAIANLFDANHNSNELWQYMQNLNADTANQLFRPSTEAAQVMEGQIISLLGGLPPQHFDVRVSTTREQLGQLLASAMMGGYFLHKAEQRMALEQRWHEDDPTPDHPTAEQQ